MLSKEMHRMICSVRGEYMYMGHTKEGPAFRELYTAIEKLEAERDEYQTRLNATFDERLENLEAMNQAADTMAQYRKLIERWEKVTGSTLEELEQSDKDHPSACPVCGDVR